jgi:hypothetical protein
MRESLGHKDSSTSLKSINKSGAKLFNATLKKDSTLHSFTENPMLIGTKERIP